MKIIITESQYNRIINEDQGFKKMGQGNYGSVFLKNDKVYKITEDEDEVVVSKGLLKSKRDFKHFPKIYSIVNLGENMYGELKYGIIRKSYDPLVNVSNYRDIINLIKKYQRDIMSYIPNQRNGLPTEVKDNKFLLDTIHGIIDEFSTLNLPDYKLLDFHLNNLGVDDQGNIVLFDF
jgi:hypothetical protein